MRAKVKYWLAPGLRTVELSAADYVAQRFSPHWHAGFAVGVVTHRAQGFQAQGREWVVGPGDLIVLNPGQVHDGYSLDPAGWSSRMAYIPEDAFATLAGQPTLAFEMRFTQATVHSPVLARAFLEWHQMCESAGDVRSLPHSAYVFSGLCSLMQSIGTVGVAKAAQNSAEDLRQRLIALAGNGDASVAGLNADLNLSRYGSWRRVKNELGLAPKALLCHLRLMSAKQLLVKGHRVVEAALECGYHDQSHFSHQFAAAYGFTPAQFRRAQLALV